MVDDGCAQFGPFFQLSTNFGPEAVKFSEIIGLQNVFDQRLRHASAEMERRSGAQPTDRVVASTIFLGFAARVISPGLGLCVSTEKTYRADATQWYIRDGYTKNGDTRNAPPEQLELWPVGVLPPAHDDATLPMVATKWVDYYLECIEPQLLSPLGEQISHLYGVSPKIISGNCASAVMGALQMISTHSTELAAVARKIAEEFVNSTGSGTLGNEFLSNTEGRRSFGPWGFIRHSCCLFYQIPHAGTCADCILS